MEPGTAEPEGYLAEKRKGNIMVLPPRGVWQCRVLAGALSAAESAAMEARIETAMGRSRSIPGPEHQKRHDSWEICEFCAV